MDEANRPDHDTAAAGSDRKRRRRVLIRALVLVPACLIAMMLFLLRSEPAYWTEHQRFLRDAAPEQIGWIAEGVEERIGALAGVAAGAVKPEDIRIDAVGTLHLSRDELRALVVSRTDRWMKSRGFVKPNQVRNPMVSIDDGKIVLAFEFVSGVFSQVISTVCDVSIQDDGMALLTVGEFRAGNLSVPAQTIGEYLREQFSDDGKGIAKAGRWLGKLKGVRFRPVLDDLPHRRRARVVAFELVEDGLDLTVRIQDHHTYKSTNLALKAGQTTNLALKAGQTTTLAAVPTK